MSPCRSASRERGNSTKKFARIEPQSTLRRLVMRPSTGMPATSKRMVSPRPRPRLAASRSSTLIAPGSSGVQRPAVTVLRSGSTALWLRLNSRSTVRFCASSAKLADEIGRPSIATSRPRNIGYQS